MNNLCPQLIKISLNTDHSSTSSTNQSPMEAAEPEMARDSEADGPSVSPSDISLRLLTLDDVDDFMVWATDAEVARFCTLEPCQSREDAVNFITDVVLLHPWFRAICLRGRPIGEISVTVNTGADCCRGEMGYRLASRYWGKGIATVAVKTAAAAVFWEQPELERVEALVDVENVGSQRVLEKAGFTREATLRKYYVLNGRTRDMVMFSLLSTD